MRTRAKCGFVAVSLLLCLSASAQAMPWHYGVRAGLNGARFAGEFGELAGPDTRFGLNAGVVVEAAVAPGWAFHTGAAYASKGGTSTSQGTDPFGNPTGTFKDRWAMDYIEIPLLVRAELLRSAPVSPFLELGPSIGITVRGRFEFSDGRFPDVDLKKDMKTFDPGFSAGGGVRFAAGSGRMGVEGRYTRGFGDAFDLNDNAALIQQTWTFALSWTR